MSVETEKVIIMKSKHATKAQKNAGIKLWNAIKEEVNFTDEFDLEGELKQKADELLQAMKIQVWRISLAKGTKNEALKVVFTYNQSVNDLLAEKMEPERDDFVKNQAVDEDCPPDTQEG